MVSENVTFTGGGKTVTTVVRGSNTQDAPFGLTGFSGWFSVSATVESEDSYNGDGALLKRRHYGAQECSVSIDAFDTLQNIKNVQRIIFDWARLNTLVTVTHSDNDGDDVEVGKGYLSSFDDPSLRLSGENKTRATLEFTIKLLDPPTPTRRNGTNV